MPAAPQHPWQWHLLSTILTIGLLATAAVEAAGLTGSCIKVMLSATMMVMVIVKVMVMLMVIKMVKVM